jgi:hypothetical protein
MPRMERRVLSMLGKCSTSEPRVPSRGFRRSQVHSWGHGWGAVGTIALTPQFSVYEELNFSRVGCHSLALGGAVGFSPLVPVQWPGQRGPGRCRCPTAGGGCGGDFLASVGSRPVTWQLCGFLSCSPQVSPSRASLTQDPDKRAPGSPRRACLAASFPRLC